MKEYIEKKKFLDCLEGMLVNEKEKFDMDKKTWNTAIQTLISVVNGLPSSKLSQ